MNLTKTILVGVVILFTTISLFSANITIIESQSIHPLHKMDENWQNVALSLGYNATISPQQFLDDINNLSNSDILIISSGLINLPENRKQTIKQFVEQGGNLYIQSEYLVNLPGNQVFTSLVNDLGGSFTWDGELAGSLAPMNIVGDLANNFNTVTSLTYYWYGTHGSGNETIHSFLQFNGMDWGFIFCPVTPTFGKIITTSDQDWVRTQNNEELVANILTYLVAHMPLSALPLVSIDGTEEGPCDDITYTFNATVGNAMGGSQLQWLVNGVNVIGETSSTFVSSDLNDGDVVECMLVLSTFCTSYSHTSNPILIAPINPLSSASFEIYSDGTTFCQNESVTFNSIASGFENATNISYQWIVNGNPVLGANSESFTTSDLSNLDTVNCVIFFDENCFTNNTLESAPVILNIISQANPTAIIEADQSTICEGESITFTVIGNDLGNNPIFQWQIDGIDVGTNNVTFTTNLISTGQNITCTINTNQDCASISTITTNAITINVAPVTLPSITISPNATEICPGEEVTFTASGNNFGANPTFQWQIDGINVGANQAEFTTNQLTNGQLVTCVLTADMMCQENNIVESQPVSVLVWSNNLPVVQVVSNATEICKGEAVIFTAFGNNYGTNPLFQWMIDGVPVSCTDSIFTTTTLNNGQLVSCQIINPDACAAYSTALSNTISVKVNEIKVEVLEIEFENCGNADGMIEIEGTGGTEPYTYEWMNGANENLLTDLSYGKFTVTITDAIGCSAIGQIEMGKNDAPEVSNIIITGSDCEGDNGAAEIVLLDPSTSYAFEWLNNEGTLVSITNLANNLQTGAYSVIITNEYGCTTTETVIIDQISSIEVVINDDLQLNLGESFQLESIVNTTDGVTYQWEEVDGLSCTACPSPVIIPTESTIYTVTVTNEYGCTATDEVKIHVTLKRDVFIPNAFSPNNDGVNDFFTVFAGENVQNIKSMHLFDRWGGEIFSKSDFVPNDETEGWNGVYKGQLLQSGVYVFLIEVEYIDGKTKLHKGDVSITPN